jgi:photosystem II stability/assembly factor-like uncharacterized protein
VSDVAVSPNFGSDRLVLAATLAGIFRSTDAGRRWMPGAKGLSDPTTHTLAFADELTVFTATQGGRLYRSSDGGASWQEMTAWAGLGVIVALAISPNYAEDGTVLVATAAGIFRSHDRGMSWQAASFGLLDLDLLCVACSPDFADSEVAWAGTALGGFFRSRNAGRAWRESGTGLPESAINCLAVSPAFVEDRTLFVGTETAGVFRSTDAGTTWRPVGPELAGQCVNCLSISPYFSDNQTILSGTTEAIFRSEDGGEHWTATQGGTGIPLALALTEGSYAIAGAYQDGIFISEDEGRNWRRSVEGLAAHVPPLVLRCPEPVEGMSPREELFAVGMGDGIVRSEDRGATWQACDAGLESVEIQAAAVTGDGGQTTLSVATDAGLYRSDNLGTAWVPVVCPAETAGQIHVLVLSPNFHRDHTVLLGDHANRLFVSGDAGNHWHALSAPQAGSILNASFSPFYATDRTINLVTAIQNDRGGFQMQVWQSADSGDHWLHIADYSAEIPVAAVAMPRSSTWQVLFLATQNRVIRLSRSLDDGHWASSQFFFEDAISVTAVAASSGYEADHTVFVATNRGVFCSWDAGTTWEALGTGLEDRAVVAVFPSPQYPDNGQVCAVTLGGAIWWLKG